ncbi:MAG: exosome complex protein Rrp42 [Thermoplasmata archaeon]
MEEDAIAELKREYINRLFAESRRIDGRAPDEIRPVSVETGVVKNADGSARVKWGETDVLVGVKMELGQPFPDAPDKGVLVTNAELIPMASPYFEPGPPRPESIELARVVDRGIREAQTIDLSSLCITPKEKVWVAFVDIHALDFSGNLFDAASLGALMALNTTTVPAKRFDLGEDFRLKVDHYPISCTSVKIDRGLLVDPCLDEERVARARLTVTTDENGDIRAMQKGIGGKLTLEEVKAMIQTSQRVGRELRQKFRLGV